MRPHTIKHKDLFWNIFHLLLCTINDQTNDMLMHFSSSAVGKRKKQSGLDFIFPSHDLQLFLGRPEASCGCIISPMYCECATGLLPVGCAQNSSPGKHPGGILMRCLNSLMLSLVSKLPHS